MVFERKHKQGDRAICCHCLYLTTKSNSVAGSVANTLEIYEELIVYVLSGSLCENKASSLTPEVDNLLHCRPR